MSLRGDGRRQRPWGGPVFWGVSLPPCAPLLLSLRVLWGALGRGGGRGCSQAAPVVGPGRPAFERRRLSSAWPQARRGRQRPGQGSLGDPSRASPPRERRLSHLTGRPSAASGSRSGHTAVLPEKVTSTCPRAQTLDAAHGSRLPERGVSSWTGPRASRSRVLEATWVGAVAEGTAAGARGTGASGTARPRGHMPRAPPGKQAACGDAWAPGPDSCALWPRGAL